MGNFFFGLVVGVVLSLTFCSKAKAHDDAALQACQNKCEMEYDLCVRRGEVSYCRGFHDSCRSECTTWDMNH